MDAARDDSMEARIAALERENAALRGEREVITAEREALKSERDVLTAEREALRSQREALAGEVRRLSLVEQTLLLRQQELKRKLDRARRQLKQRIEDLYGQSAEQLHLPLFDGMVEAVQAQADAESTHLETSGGEVVQRPGPPQTRAKRKSKLANLPIRLNPIDLPEDQKPCPCCGEQRVHIATAMTEHIECQPMTLTRVITTRNVYNCPLCLNQVAKAPAPPQAIQKCWALPSLLATVAVNKYGMHQPLYRQEELFARSGVFIGRSTQCRWMAQVADACEPIVRLMARQMLAYGLVLTDDTPTPVLDPGRGKTREGRFWVYLGTGPDPAHECRYAVFDYSPNREGRWAREFLEGYDGYLQADAYSGYDALFRSGRIVEVGCWAHTRRKFLAARDLAPEFCAGVLGLIRSMYALEKRVRKLSHAQRLAERQRHSAPIIAELRRRLDEQAASGRVLPKSDLGTAIEYALKHWTALTRFLEDGELEMDNNASERALRTVAIGRKNWMFCGSDNGGRTAAILFSMIASARLHEIEPWAYLKSVLEELPKIASPDGLRDLLPDRWKAAHPGHHLPLARER